MSHYKHLNIEEREKLYLMLNQGISIRRIAASLNRSPSTVSREIHRNQIFFKPYSPSIAQTRYQNRRKALFKNIYIEGSHEEDPVDKILPRTYKSYYYGDTDISTLAKKICGNLDKVQFSDFLSLESDDSIENLCRVFRDDCSGINAENYGSKLADRFEIIITNASKPKKKKKSALSGDGTSAPNGIDIKEKYGIALVAEVMSTCPNIGCTNSLFMREGKQIVPHYEIVMIDPDEPIEECNLIAMCPSCSNTIFQ